MRMILANGYGSNDLSGTDLGSETVTSYDTVPSGPTNIYVATASFNFNTDGTVTVTQVGSNKSSSTPFTNWNVNGGTHLSYEVITSIFDVGASATITGSLASSTAAGENRHALSGICAFNLTGTSDDDTPNPFEGTYVLKISIWDAASGGNRKAFGQYTHMVG